MEALVLIFAEIIFACLAPLLSILGALAAALVEFFLAMLGLFFGMVSARRPGPRAPRKPVVPRRTLHWAAGILAALGGLGVAASVLFFQPLLRHVMQTAAERAGMEIRYEAARGTLLFGHVKMEGVELRRESDDGLAFHLTVAQAEADVALWSLLGSEPRLALARVEGLSGQVSPPARDREAPRATSGRAGERRPFVVDLAQVAGVDLEVRPKDGPAYGLRIDTAEVAPFHSRTALFDLFFRSTLHAEIAGQSLSVETREITERGRETFWRFEDVEADKLRLVVPKPPLTWIDGGTLTAVVEDRWSLSDEFIEMDWRVGLKDVQVSPPGDVGLTEKTLALALGKLVDLRNGNADFRYRLQLDRDAVQSLRSGDLRQFWDTVLAGFLDTGPASGGDEAGESSEEQPGRVRRALEDFRSLIGRGEEADGDE